MKQTIKFSPTKGFFSYLGHTESYIYACFDKHVVIKVKMANS